jgi:hypothetical protein
MGDKGDKPQSTAITPTESRKMEPVIAVPERKSSQE